MTEEPNYFAEPPKINDAMKQALARAYGDRDFRDYITRAAQASHFNALKLLNTGKHEEATMFANRAVCWKELLERGKAEFLRFESISNKLKEPLKDYLPKDLEGIKL